MAKVTPIFYEDSDRDLLDELVARATVADGVRIHAYCWMTNHIHLAVEVGARTLGHFVQRVASQYARRVQLRLPTTGHLFERRHRAILVQDTAYLVGLVRYIHRNPVRAGLVRDPIEYRWSSHRAYMGLVAIPWLTVEPTLATFADRPAAAREAYQRFTSNDGPESELGMLRGGHLADPRVLGDDQFIAGLTATGATSRETEPAADVAARYAMECGVSLAALKSASRRRELCRIRAHIAERLIERKLATLSEVARIFNRSPSTLHSSLNRYRGGSFIRIIK